MAVSARAGIRHIKILEDGQINKEEQLWCVLNAAVEHLVRIVEK